MKLLTFEYQGKKHAGVLTGDGVAPISEINARHGTDTPDDLLGIIRAGIEGIYTAGVPTIPITEVTPRLPYDTPPKIWCIGLNYLSHAEDINAVQPEEPGSFMKPASCLFEPGGKIVLPPKDISDDVDAEGELGVIIGKTCKYVPAGDIPSVIFGYTTTMDLTALDILRKNPRYLTRSKSIDTFFSFGPVIVTRDEIADVEALEVITEHNEGICSRDFVRHMRTRPFELVRFHSDHMTLNPGDVLSTGCPKGARIKAGDRVRSRIEGVGTLSATVTQGQPAMIVLLLLLATLCSAAESAKSGPAVGAKIPDFEAADQKGQRQTFASLKGPKGLVLMFVRSADWCPYCKAQLVDLNQQVDEYKKRGLNVASLTNDSVAILKNYSSRRSIRFPMLSDPESKAIRAFGILNESAPKDTPFYGIPYPGTYVIDEKGVVKSKYFEPDFRETYTAASILTHEFAADGKQKSAVETPHLKLSYAAADTALAPGGRTSLILDMDLKPAMHVYAPGVEGGYISVEWNMVESKSWSALPVVFPPSRKLRLEAIDETVPVYQGKARLVRDLAVDKNAATGSDVTVEGTFRYQACDDHMCYLPKSIPLKWTFKVLPLDSQRVPEDLQRK